VVRRKRDKKCAYKISVRKVLREQTFGRKEAGEVNCGDDRGMTVVTADL
jgi:hypothetical protein